nr:MAG TPA: cysteine-rich protein [Caudoviricetes sp.]
MTSRNRPKSKKNGPALRGGPLEYIMEFKCKECGNTDLFEQRNRASGTVTTLYSANGEEADNSQMYNGIVEKPRKYMYCNRCGARQKFTLDQLRNKGE